MAETKTPHPLSIEGRELRLNELLDRVAATPDGRDLSSLRELTTLLPDSDGEPLETNWHNLAIHLLRESLRFYWADRSDYYCGGNMFVYFDPLRLRNQNFRGPDFFVVLGVSGRKIRRFWATWEEDWKLPNVVVELLSPSTREEDLTTKKQIYAQVWKTADYFCYDPESLQLVGWTLNTSTGEYEPKIPNERGWLRSEQLGLWVGLWEGQYWHQDTWLRLFEDSGRLLSTPEESYSARLLQATERIYEVEEQLRVERERAEVVTEEEQASLEQKRGLQKENEELQRLLKATLTQLESNTTEMTQLRKAVEQLSDSRSSEQS